MKLNYTRFFIIFFFIIFFHFSYLKAQTSNEEIFEVKNILVDVSSTSSAKAREIAFLEAQEKGFNNLMNKILLKQENEKIESLDIKKISELVEAIGVESEKTTSVRYKGYLSIKFNEDKIINFLNKNNLKFTIIKSKPLLILPIYKFAGVTYLWEKENIWRKIWTEESNDHSLITIKASEGKFTDFIFFNPDQTVKKNLKNLELLAKSYNSTGVLIAILKKKYNRDKSKILFNLDLSIQRFDGGDANTFKDEIEIYSNEYSEEILLEAKNKVEQFVSTQWKTSNVVSSRKKLEKITVLFNNLSDWTNIKKTINNMPMIDKYNVTKFSYNKATIFLSFSGSLNQLKVAFRQSDLVFDLNNKNLALEN